MNLKVKIKMIEKSIIKIFRDKEVFISTPETSQINIITKLKYCIKIIDNDLFYISMPKSNEEIVKKNIDLSKIIQDYKGPSVYLDFNDKNELIGIEILD